LRAALWIVDLELVTVLPQRDGQQRVVCQHEIRFEFLIALDRAEVYVHFRIAFGRKVLQIHRGGNLERNKDRVLPIAFVPDPEESRARIAAWKDSILQLGIMLLVLALATMFALARKEPELTIPICPAASSLKLLGVAWKTGTWLL